MATQEQWLSLNQALPTDAIDLEREPELPTAHLQVEELRLIQQALELPSLTQMRDRAIVAVLSHGLRASEVSALNVEHWNGKVLTVYRSKGQNLSEVPLSRAARSHLQAYLTSVRDKLNPSFYRCWFQDFPNVSASFQPISNV